MEFLGALPLTPRADISRPPKQEKKPGDGSAFSSSLKSVSNGDELPNIPSSGNSPTNHLGFGETIADYIFNIPNRLTSSFVNALVYVKNKASDLIQTSIWGIGGIANLCNEEGYQAWLEDYQCETHELAISLGPPVGNNRAPVSPSSKAGDSEKGKDTILSREHLCLQLKKLPKIDPVTVAIAYLDLANKKKIPLSIKEWSYVSAKIQLALKDYKKEFKEKNQTYEAIWEAYKNKRNTAYEQLVANIESQANRAPTEQEESQAWEDAVNDREVANLYAHLDNDQTTKSLADDIGHQDFILRALEGLDLQCKVAFGNLAREASIPEIVKINHKKDNQGYSETTTKGGSIGLATGAPGITVGGFFKFLFSWIYKKVVDDEGYYGELTLAQIGTTAGVALVKDEVFNLVDVTPFAVTATKAEGEYKEWADQKNDAANQFRLYIDENHRNSNLTPYLSRRKALSPTNFVDGFVSDLEKSGITTAASNLYEKIRLAGRNYLLDSLTGHEVVEIDSLNAKYEQTKEDRERRLNILASASDQTIPDTEAQRKIRELNKLEELANLQIEVIKSAHDRKMEKIDNKLLSHEEKSELRHTCVYVTESRIKKVEKELLIAKLRIEMDASEEANFEKEDHEFISKKHRIEEIYLTEKLQHLEKFFIKKIKSVADEDLHGQRLIEALNHGFENEKAFITKEFDAEIRRLKLELSGLQQKLQDLNMDLPHLDVIWGDKSLAEVIKRIEEISNAKDEPEQETDLQSELRYLNVLKDRQLALNKIKVVTNGTHEELAALQENVGIGKKWLQHTLEIERLKRECESKIDEKTKGVNPMQGIEIEEAITKQYKKKIKQREKEFKNDLLKESGNSDSREFSDWVPADKTKAPITFIPLPVGNLNRGVFKAGAELLTVHGTSTAKVDIFDTGFGAGIEANFGWEHFKLTAKRFTPLIEGMSNPLKSTQDKRDIQKGVEKQFEVIGEQIIKGWQEENAQIKLTSIGDKVLKMLGMPDKSGAEEELWSYLETNGFEDEQITNLVELRSTPQEKAKQALLQQTLFKEYGLIQAVEKKGLDIKECFSYLKRDFTSYMGFQEKIALLENKEKDAEELKNINASLEKLFNRYGAKDENQFKRNLIFVNAHLFGLVSLDNQSNHHKVPIPKLNSFPASSSNSDSGEDSAIEGAQQTTENTALRVDEGEKIIPSQQKNPLGTSMQELEASVLATVSGESAEVCKIREGVTYETKDWKAKGELKAFYGWVVNLGGGLKAEILVRERLHTNTLRSGFYIDVVMSGGATLGINEIAAISKVLKGSDVTKEFGLVFESSLEGVGPALPLVSGSGEATVQMRWFKPHELPELGYQQLFTRVLLSKAWKLPIPEFALPLIPGLNLTGDISYSLSDSDCLYEWYTGDTMFYYALRYMNARARSTIDAETGVVKEDSYWRIIEQQQKGGITALFSNFAQEQMRAAQPGSGLAETKRICNLIDSTINNDGEANQIKRCSQQQLKDEIQHLKIKLRKLTDSIRKEYPDKALRSSEGTKIVKQWVNIKKSLDEMAQIIRLSENVSNKNQPLDEESANKIYEKTLAIAKACKEIISKCDTKNAIKRSTEEFIEELEKINGMVDKRTGLARLLQTVDATLGTEMLPKFDETFGPHLLKEMGKISESVVKNEALNHKDEVEKTREYKTNKAKFIFAKEQFLHATVVFELEQKITQLQSRIMELKTERDNIVQKTDPGTYASAHQRVGNAEEVLDEAYIALQKLKGILPTHSKSTDVAPCFQSFRDFLQAYAPHCNERKANSHRYREDGKKPTMANIQTEKWENIERTSGASTSTSFSESDDEGHLVKMMY